MRPTTAHQNESNLQSVALALSGVATLVAALGGVEFPREVDADTAGIIVLAELRANIDAAVGCHLCITGMQDILDRECYVETLVLQELPVKSEIDSASAFPLGRTCPVIGCQVCFDVQQPVVG